jgi:hypothetical protein
MKLTDIDLYAYTANLRASLSKIGQSWVRKRKDSQMRSHESSNTGIRSKLGFVKNKIQRDTNDTLYHAIFKKCKEL